jgi:hypothetical protein
MCESHNTHHAHVEDFFLMKEKKLGDIIINHPRRRIDRQFIHLRPCHFNYLLGDSMVLLVLVLVLVIGGVVGIIEYRVT